MALSAKQRKLLILSVLLCVLKIRSFAVPLDAFYPFGEGSADQKLPSRDDVSTEEIRLKVPIVYYEQVYNAIYVNSNGFLSFLTEIPNFFNMHFPLEYPVIAGIYSDVDITTSGNIFYRETTDESILTRAANNLKRHFGASFSFQPKTAFIATWDGVAPYKPQDDLTNTFQLILITDGIESYAFFHYADNGVQWLRSGGKNPSLPDAYGQAGLVSGDGRLYSLKGSGTDQARNLDKWSNIDVPGAWAFRIGKTGPTGNVGLPDLKDGILKDFLTNAEEIEDTCNLCHSSAICVQYKEGSCCECKEGSYGNGINCLKNDEPLRVSGRVLGSINSVELTDSDLHSYVLVSEGRVYTALSNVPGEIGYDLQSLTNIGTGIAWLFAVPVVGVKNGYQMTGGNLNRTVEIEFPLYGHRVVIQQLFDGLDVFNNIPVKTQIKGTVPTIPIGAKIEMDAFKEEYTRTRPGQLRSRSSRVFRLKGQEFETPYNVETTIDYEGCQYEPLLLDQETLRLKVTPNIFIQYDKPEKIVRFAMSAKIGPLEEEDPCIRGKEECGLHSQCIVDDDTFRCVCDRGFEQIYDSLTNAAYCLDINECQSGRDQCDSNAACLNSEGSYSCRCKEGYVGDGSYCEAKVTCAAANCDKNAICEMVGSQAVCTCKAGFFGSGHVCYPDDSGFDDDRLVKSECGRDLVCSPYADCSLRDDVTEFVCICRSGYFGDGVHCELDANRVSCDKAKDCSPFGECRKVNNRFQCVCIPGFAGDGYTCELDPSFQINLPIYPIYQVGENNTYPSLFVQPVEDDDLYNYNPIVPEFHEHIPADCVGGICWCPFGYDFNNDETLCYPKSKESVFVIADTGGPKPKCSAAKCTCPQGYIYNTVLNVCDAATDVSCNILNNCHPDAQCTYNSILNKYTCECNAGYEGNGYMCIEMGISCDELSICSIHATCVYDDYLLRSVCVCEVGYEGDGIVCIPKDECNASQDCHPNAQCLYESYSQKYKCICNPGYEGTSKTCSAEKDAGCNVINTCDANAECIYDAYSFQHRCQCHSGFEGDGLTCTPVQIGCNIVYNCGRDAVCEYDSESGGHRCKCRTGFAGDGFFCRSTLCYEDPTVCHKYAACIPDTSIPSGYSCACLSGYIGDGHSCESADVDCLKGRYYWTDVGTASIRSSSYDGTDKMPVITKGAGSPEDVAIDWISGNIYWTDSETDAIIVVSLNGTHKRTIIKEGLVNPRGIAVHPGHGALFWSDWNRLGPKIESSALDGSNRRTLVDSAILLPNSLIVDYDYENLCWADAGTHKIECIGFLGEGRRVITDRAKYPFGLAIHDRRFIYSDWNDTRIHLVDAATGFEEPSVAPPPGGAGKLYGVAVVPEVCPRISNVCYSSRGGCPHSHLCLPNSRGGRTCACPDEDLSSSSCKDYNF